MAAKKRRTTKKRTGAKRRKGAKRHVLMRHYHKAKALLFGTKKRKKS